MDEIPLYILFLLLGVSVLVSAFFSSSETGMMALDRYRLRHLAKEKNRAALRVEKLLKRPDRLIGLILLGNNLINIIAATIATLIGMRLLGDLGVALAPFVLVIVFLIFAEVVPKTVAAMHPEAIAFPFSAALRLLMWLLWPAVHVVNRVSNGILALFRLHPSKVAEKPLSREELYNIVRDANHLNASRHQEVLLNILDLEGICVEDIMTPPDEISGLNIEDDSQDLMEQIVAARHVRMPVFSGNLDHIKGTLHIGRILPLLEHERKLDKETLLQTLHEPVFIPERTSLYSQLFHFQKRKRHLGLVVDEYGTVQGMVTLEDILAEIFGRFSTHVEDYVSGIKKEPNGDGWLLDGSLTLRDLNQQLGWELPTGGPRTLNGLILEHMEQIPEAGVSLRIGEHIFEITQTSDNAVKKVKAAAVFPKPGED